MTTQPQFSVLDSAQCVEILERNHIGRLAFQKARTVDIEPLGYVARGHWIFMRSAQGSKLEALARNPYVAFEVDEIDGPLDWRSVVVHGTVYMLPPDGAPIEQREFERALTALRTIVPGALGPTDPVPERSIVYGLHVGDMEGRMARSSRVTGKERVSKRPPKKKS